MKKSFIFKSFIAVLFLGLFAWSPLSEAAIKVGVVDMQLALDQVKRGKKVTKSLEKSFKTRKAKLDKQQKDFEKLRASFEKQAPLLKAAERNKKEAELRNQFMALQQLAQKSQAEMHKEELDAKQPIIQELSKMVDSVGKKSKVDMVVEKKTSGILFAQNYVDLTKDLVKAYDKKYK